MAMQIGAAAATSGMAKAIYDQIAANLEPDIAPLKDADKTPVREGWKKLAHAIAAGVVNHIQANLELLNMNETGPPVLPVTDETVTIEGVLFR